MTDKITIEKISAYFPVLPAVMVSVRGASEGLEKDNIITVGRITPLTTAPPRLVISIKKSTFSYPQIIETGEFVVNHVHEGLLFACDLCGVVSGRDHDKFVECVLTPEPMRGLRYARAIRESRLSLGCRLVQEIDDYENYGILIGEVVSVSAAKEVLPDCTEPVSHLLGAVVFDGVESSYLYNGRKIGHYGYSAYER
jgi:flavin reductase (DIM6/NTAB) family NADH-FMN oxidoreductase RutF